AEIAVAVDQVHHDDRHGGQRDRSIVDCDSVSVCPRGEKQPHDEHRPERGESDEAPARPQTEDAVVWKEAIERVRAGHIGEPDDLGISVTVAGAEYGI